MKNWLMTSGGNRLSARRRLAKKKKMWLRMAFEAALKRQYAAEEGAKE